MTWRAKEFTEEARRFGYDCLQTSPEGRFICNVIRRIYHLALAGETEEIPERCAEAMWMAKRMVAHMAAHKGYKHEEFWDLIEVPEKWRES